MDSGQQETPPAVSDKTLKDELSTLRIFRATLESVKQVVDGIHRDTVTAKGNCGAVVVCWKRRRCGGGSGYTVGSDIIDLTKRWEEVILETSSPTSVADEAAPGGLP